MQSDVNDLEDAPVGPLDKILFEEIQNSVVLLVLSKNSITEPRVRFELQNAAEIGVIQGGDKLIPISLDNSFESYDWPLRLKQYINNYNIPNFSQWNDEDMFDKRFQQVLTGLGLYYM